jgi:putative ABC transport system permease protein
MSVALLLSVERAERAAHDGFTQAISQTDLIVGARSSPVQLVLYSLFNMGNATNNISIESFEHFKNHAAVDWVIPFSMGDGHKGFRVVGTTDEFFKHYHFRGDDSVSFSMGSGFTNMWSAVVGSEVALKLNYKLGDKIVLAHGVTKEEGVQHHDDKPFTIVGILNSTGTTIDRSVYVTLKGIEGIHVDWHDGAQPTKDHMIPADHIHEEEIKVDEVTGFFLRTRSRIETLKLQREINDYAKEPMLAVIPGVALNEIWQGLSYLETTLRVISWMVILVGIVSQLIALLTSIEGRRREMSILRAMGAQLNQILSLVVIESIVLTSVGILSGVLLSLGCFKILSPWLESTVGFYLTGDVFSPQSFFYLGLTMCLGLVAGVFPAYRMMRMALKDGLSVRS